MFHQCWFTVSALTIRQESTTGPFKPKDQPAVGLNLLYMVIIKKIYMTWWEKSICVTFLYGNKTIKLIKVFVLHTNQVAVETILLGPVFRKRKNAASFSRFKWNVAPILLFCVTLSIKKRKSSPEKETLSKKTTLSRPQINLQRPWYPPVFPAVVKTFEILNVLSNLPDPRHKKGQWERWSWTCWTETRWPWRTSYELCVRTPYPEQ